MQGLRHVRRRANVQTGLDGQRHAGLQGYPGVVPCLVSTGIMHVEAQPMAGAVHVERLVGFTFDQSVDAAVQQAQIDHALHQHP